MKQLKDGEIYGTFLVKYFVHCGKAYEISNDEYFILNSMSQCDRMNKFQELYRNRG